MSKNASSPEPIMTAAPNKVQDLRNRIANEFGGKQRKPTRIREGESLDSVRYFLDCIGWSGNDRRFFEAQPYIDPVNEVNGLRTLLFKLDFTTTLGRAESTKLRPEFLPCFLIDRQRRLHVVRRLDENG